MNADQGFMAQAIELRQRSTDRSRRVGCVIVSAAGQVIAEGWNTVPNGCAHTEARHARPAKYLWTEHAERNAIYAAARMGRALDGSTAYVPWFPCADCARGLIQAGVVRLVAFEPDFADPTWGESFSMVAIMLAEAGMMVDYLLGANQPQPG
jgi:dCMP deaminase